MHEGLTTTTPTTTATTTTTPPTTTTPTTTTTTTTPPTTTTTMPKKIPKLLLNEKGKLIDVPKKIEEIKDSYFILYDVMSDRDKYKMKKVYNHFIENIVKDDFLS
jgi:hypothetical protein